MKIKDVGPAIIVAACVLGPGSILVSSKVGAEFGLAALAVLAGACVLLFGMITMSARIGVMFDGTPGEELTARLGRIPSALVGLALFGIVAIFQSSNNMAIIAGLEPIFEQQAWFASLPAKMTVLVLINMVVILFLYTSRDLYKKVERLMKSLVLFMMVAFLLNFLFVLFNPPAIETRAIGNIGDTPPNYLLLIGLIGTTFSVAGAYYQAYLVREKGWTSKDLAQGIYDSGVGVSVLGAMTAVILSTSAIMFFGKQSGVSLSNVGELALQLKPIFGRSAVLIFSMGIFAGAFSSFLINAIIGGTILSDSLGLGAKLFDRWPKHLTAFALVLGAVFGSSSLLSKDSTVHLITFAQALTVIGIPAIALAILFLGTRTAAQSTQTVPRWMLALVAIGTILSFALALNTISKVARKLRPSLTSAAQPIERNLMEGPTLVARSLASTERIEATRPKRVSAAGH